jgi:hypothetical protein
MENIMLTKMKTKLLLGGVGVIAGFVILKTVFFWVIAAAVAFGGFKYLTRSKS